MSFEIIKSDINKGQLGKWLAHLVKQTKLTYKFRNHFHPYVGYLIERLNQGDLEDLLAINTQERQEPFFNSDYILDPDNDSTLAIEYEDKSIDLEVSGAYSIYNWELFFHVPLTIAVQLSKNQRFAEAQRWFHFIFDPTTDEPDLPGNPVGRYWKFRKMRETTDPLQITDLLESLAANVGDEDVDPIIKDLRNSIAEWRKTPFSPHSVAKFRPLAYQFHVIMKYLDNLFDWGDSLFRQFTIETLNEATQVYVVAANILGDRPQEIPKLRKRPVRNYREIKGKLDEFGNFLDEMQNEFPLNANLAGTIGFGSDSSRARSLYGMAQELFFCIPKNDNLMQYWDKIEDRLFKIRHGMDIEGNIRPLPLFQPPIDPGMLVKAAAAGLDLSSVVAGLGQPVSKVRFRVVIQKALEICSELRSLGSSLLSVLEKGDGEHLANMRQSHELNILELSQDVRYLQWKDAEAATTVLLASRDATYQRYRHYQILLGVAEGEIGAVEELTLDRPELTEENFEDVYEELVNQAAAEINLEDYREEKLGLIGEAASAVSGLVGAVEGALSVGSSDHLQLNKTEDIELNVMMPLATVLNLFSGYVGAVSTVLSLVPQFDAHGTPMGVGVATEFGGRQLSAAASYASQLIRLGGDIISYQGTRASKLGAYQRRIDDWVLQNNLAAKELRQLGRQIVGALIREQIFKKDYENHKTQIEQSTAVRDFLKEQKFTNEDLYLWMQGETSKVYYDCYKFAFDTAKKAEATIKHELMREEITERDFIRFNYWDTGRKGLLSGDALYLDLKRMEMVYHEANKREFELTKHVSLRQLNPLALLQLKATGSCQVELPEWLFDLDAPGHYMRRIKTVGVSIPSVTGPYTSIHCTVSLQKSSIRTSSLLSEDGYPRNPDGDIRFQDYYGEIQSVVTSHVQNDSGMFEVNLNDDRFLPFEGAGVISTWTLDLPKDLRQFDYDTISDVLLHIRYTARQGGTPLRDKAVDKLKTMISEATQSPLKRLFSLRYDFPNEWHRFSDEVAGDLTITLHKDHFPYMVSTRTISIDTAETEAYEIADGNKLSTITNPFDALTTEFDDEAGKQITFKRAAIEDLEDVYLVVSYSAVPDG